MRPGIPAMVLLACSGGSNGPADASSRDGSPSDARPDAVACVSGPGFEVQFTPPAEGLMGTAWVTTVREGDMLSSLAGTVAGAQGDSFEVDDASSRRVTVRVRQGAVDVMPPVVGDTVEIRLCRFSCDKGPCVDRTSIRLGGRQWAAVGALGDPTVCSADLPFAVETSVSDGCAFTKDVAFGCSRRPGTLVVHDATTRERILSGRSSRATFGGFSIVAGDLVEWTCANPAGAWLALRGP